MRLLDAEAQFGEHCKRQIAATIEIARCSPPATFGGDGNRSAMRSISSRARVFDSRLVSRRLTRCSSGPRGILSSCKGDSRRLARRGPTRNLKIAERAVQMQLQASVELREAGRRVARRQPDRGGRVAARQHRDHRLIYRQRSSAFFHLLLESSLRRSRDRATTLLVDEARDAARRRSRPSPAHRVNAAVRLAASNKQVKWRATAPIAY